MKKSELRKLIREVLNEQIVDPDLLGVDFVEPNITSYSNFMRATCPEGYQLYTAAYTNGCSSCMQGGPGTGVPTSGGSSQTLPTQQITFGKCFPLTSDVNEPVKPFIKPDPTPPNTSPVRKPINPGTKDPVRGVDTGTSGPFQVDN